MNTSIPRPFLALPLLLALGCASAATPADSTIGTVEQGVSNESNATAADGAASTERFIEIYRGPANIVGGLTFNRAFGTLIRIRVTGCQLTSLAFSATDASTAANLIPGHAGLSPDALLGGYTGFWQLPYGAPLATVTLTASALDAPFNCYAVVEQSEGNVITAPAPTSPAPAPIGGPSACGVLNEPQCSATAACQVVYNQQWVWNGQTYLLTRRFAGCVSR